MTGGFIGSTYLPSYLLYAPKLPIYRDIRLVDKFDSKIVLACFILHKLGGRILVFLDYVLIVSLWAPDLGSRVCIVLVVVVLEVDMTSISGLKSSCFSYHFFVFFGVSSDWGPCSRPRPLWLRLLPSSVLEGLFVGHFLELSFLLSY